MRACPEDPRQFLAFVQHLISLQDSEVQNGALTGVLAETMHLLSTEQRQALLDGPTIQYLMARAHEGCS